MQEPVLKEKTKKMAASSSVTETIEDEDDAGPADEEGAPQEEEEGGEEAEEEEEEEEDEAPAMMPRPSACFAKADIGFKVLTSTGSPIDTWSDPEQEEDKAFCCRCSLSGSVVLQAHARSKQGSALWSDWSLYTGHHSLRWIMILRRRQRR